MRRIVAAAVIAVFALTLAACGDGGTAVPGAVTPTPGAGPGASVETSPSNVASDPLSPHENVNNEQFPSARTTTPAEILERLDKKQPMLILLYDPTQPSTNDVRAEVDKAVKKYRGLIDLITFDVTPISADNPDDARAKDPEVRKWFTTLTSLKVAFTPYAMFVDRYGRIVGRLNGDMDAQVVEKRILTATE